MFKIKSKYLINYNYNIYVKKKLKIYTLLFNFDKIYFMDTGTRCFLILF